MPRKTEEQKEHDSSYRMGYYRGYHGFNYVNPYRSYDEVNMHIKYKMGYQEGKMVYRRENRA